MYKRQLADRFAYVENECIGRPELQAEVLELLDSASVRIIESVIHAAAGSLAHHEPSAEPFATGQQIGAYVIMESLGRGGMGQVFRAMRSDDEFQHEVAIKVLRPEAAQGAELKSRFLSERRILASLEHPYIARLIDGGADRGQPYLVMEYARGGLPLDQYIKDRKLTTEEKLRLFLKICEAVQHAHQRLVVHRDLKPSNILVLPDGTPKLLDFGIAKLLDSDDNLRTQAPLTATGWMMLTPDYASPEQVAGEPITVASDVYSLGVVLYEAVTGDRPYRIKSYTPVEIHQAVCSAAVPAPSSVVTHASRLYRQLAGDVDNIVLMAMRKEPERRYRSVEQFASDIQAHLNGLPVSARRDTFGYRSSKFIRRNKLVLAALTVAILALAIGFGVALWQASIARQQASNAETRFRQVRQLTNRFLFEFDEKIRNLEGSTPAREALVKTANEYLASLAKDAGEDRELQRELAIAYRMLGEVQGGPRTASMGRSDDALQSYRKSVELSRRLFESGLRDPAMLEQTIEAERMLGLLENRLLPDGAAAYARRLTEAIRLAEVLLQQRRDPASLRLMASVYRESGEANADINEVGHAEQRYNQALPIFKELQRLDPGPRSDRSMAMIVHRLGDANVMLGDLDAALGFYRTSFAGFKVLATAPEAGVTQRRSFLGITLALGALLGDPGIPNLQRTAEAIEQTGSAVRIVDHLERADPTNKTAKLDLSDSLTQYSRVLRSTQPAAALAASRRAVALVQEVLATSPDDSIYQSRTIGQLTDLGMALAANRENREAILTLESALDEFAKSKKRSVVMKLFASKARRELARLLHSLKPMEARRHLDAALADSEEYLAERSNNLEMTNDLSSLYEVAGLFDPVYFGKAQKLWRDWPKHGRTSTFDRWRLNQLSR